MKSRRQGGYHRREGRRRARSVLLSLLAFLVIGSTVALASPASADDDTPLGDGFWSTRGNQIVDRHGQTVRITGVNWFGFETSDAVAHGIWSRNYKDIVKQIADLDFNVIRIPFSMDMVIENKRLTSSVNFFANPDIKKGKTRSLDVLDMIVKEAGKNGLRVILDFHNLKKENIGGQQEPLWYIPGSQKYSEKRFISVWRQLARRYKNNPTVIGADVFNEPHFQACWGCNDRSRDFRRLAKKAGDAIHKVNPRILIFVNGIEQVDGQSCKAQNERERRNIPNDCTNWGGNFAGVGRSPLKLNKSNKLVYTPHEYGLSVWTPPWFSAKNFPNNLSSVWNRNWGYIANQKIAPLMVGEFGSSLEQRKDKLWLDRLLRYMKNKGIGFTFWSYNPNSADTKGIVLDDFESIDRERYNRVKPFLEGPFPVK